MQDQIKLTPTQEANYAALWQDEVVPLAKEAPYIFQSPYYAHKGAAEAVGEAHFDESEQKAWMQYAHSRYGRLSNYSGD